MKKIICILTAIVLVLSLCACGKGDKEVQKTGENIANPMHEATEQEISNVAGELMLPAGSENISYYMIEGDPVIYQVGFDLEGTEYCYRISLQNEITDTSGMYYDWTNTEVSSVEGRDATVSWNEGEAGIIYWYDAVPGLNYSLGANSAASYDSLVSLANNMFIPVQGDVG